MNDFRLGEQTHQVLEYIRDHPEITEEQLTSELGMSRTMIDVCTGVLRRNYFIAFVSFVDESMAIAYAGKVYLENHQ